MKIRMYLLAILIVGTTVLIMNSTQAVASSDSGQAKKVLNQDSTGNWQIVPLADGKECEGMVFESPESAEQEASKIGCSGYHEHHRGDGTVVYMPCALGDADIYAVKTELLDALTKGEITQEQFDEKLAWIEAKIR